MYITRHQWASLRRDQPTAYVMRTPQDVFGAEKTPLTERENGRRTVPARPRRRPRRRGGKAERRGVSKEQVPVLVVADRAGTTVGAVLPTVNADSLRKVIGPVVDRDIILDGQQQAQPPERFLRRYRDVSIKYPGTCLQWFHRIGLEKAPPHAFLAAAIDRPCIGFAD